MMLKSDKDEKGARPKSLDDGLPLGCESCSKKAHADCVEIPKKQ